MALLVPPNQLSDRLNRIKPTHMHPGSRDSRSAWALAFCRRSQLIDSVIHLSVYKCYRPCFYFFFSATHFLPTGRLAPAAPPPSRRPRLVLPPRRQRLLLATGGRGPPLLDGVCGARPARTGLPGGDAAHLSWMAAPAEERPPRVDADHDISLAAPSSVVPFVGSSPWACRQHRRDA
jgi:hypothetical protein